MTEPEFLAGYDPAAYERPALAVDLVLLGIRAGRLAALLLRRSQQPQAGLWALPGGFVGIAETLDAAAERVLRDKAGIGRARLEQLYTFGAVDRDPRMRIVSVAYLALLPEAAFAEALAGSAALTAATLVVPWAGEAGGPVSAVTEDGAPLALALAFDHADILALAVKRLRGKLDYTDVGFALLPEHFTLRQLQDVHAAIRGAPLNKSAFRRRMRDRGWIAPTGAREAGTAFRPAELFRFDRSGQF
ncbi:ADP-ribose pyrophosphatase [Methylobacterium phyllosphaerae]|uniref:8-oxo-dGTP diphosphatase n=1 Tax=Methylobacterium phyllosphaerae TaxID=418223 RepID=A0AAE8HT57_9HYPH|nr:NUDIX domain-containing protein [Methylobacterium phyllosphaerae]APT33893.1 ADP-ribose pyrophosphatase [Methylobacterium phyllosphaerae]SFH08482.1 8-oxo-dGTP diphosphatase [Methylobacterium phyllosphaerae]